MRFPHVLVCLTALVLALPGLVVGGGQASATPFAYAVYPAPAGMGEGAGEPSIGVNWNTGAVFVQNFATTLRVDFDDASLPATAAWRDVTPLNSITNVDPILFTDHVTGRTFAGGLNGQCSVMSYTDDDGATWTPMGNACASPAFDHETIGSGPWYPGDPLTGLARHPRAVYYCAQEIYAECAVSIDGGLTFLPAVPTSVTRTPVHVGFCGGLHGSVHVGPNGVAWLPIRNCFDTATTTASGLAVSKSNGRTWTTSFLPGGNPDDGFDPDVATTPSGWAYVGYVDKQNRASVVLTKNNATSFLGPWDVGASVGAKTVAFTEMVAGDDQRAAMVFLATPDAGAAYKEGFQGVWHLYVATTLDAGATWTTVQVTQDPVQRGWICTMGVSCPDTGTRGRNLLDFFDAQVDADGRVLAAFADGCVGACAGPAGTPAQSTSDYATVVRQACGPSLFAGKGNVEGATPCVFGPPTLPAAVPLAGTFYARSTYPVGNVEANPGLQVGGHPDFDRRSLSPDAPTSATPSVAIGVPLVGGTSTGTGLGAQWALPAPTGGWRLDGSTLRVVLHAAGEAALSQRLNVTLHDAGYGLAQGSPSGNYFAAQTVTLPTGAAIPQEIVLEFPGVTRTLAKGLALVVQGEVGSGDVQVYYDSVEYPTRVEIV